MSSKLTGETDIAIGDVPYTLKLTPKSAVAIEEATGLAIAQVLQQLRTPRIGLLATIILLTVQEKKKPSYDALVEAIFAANGDNDTAFHEAAIAVIGSFFPKRQEQAAEGNA